MLQPRPPIRPYMQFLFVQSGFPLELPLPRFVTSPQLFFRSGIPHHRGSLRTFTAVRISRRSYNDEAPKPFRFRGFIYPGSYLLSRDLSSDYHRRADVSLPGSEWDRVGPSGYDHQVSGSFSLLCSLLTSVIICACGFLWYFCWLPFSAAG